MGLSVMDSEYPSEMLLERQPLPYGTGKLKKSRSSRNNPHSVDLNADNGSIAPHRTSILEHIVETWLTHGKEILRREPLTIGAKTKWYPNAFKPIKYFESEKGLIYWGAVKSIRAYGNDYSITFMDKPKFGGEPRQVGIYITGEQIERYRKRRLFKRYIDALLDASTGSVNCYFVGAYPQLKSEDIVIQTADGERRFRPLEVHLKSLDHLVLHFAEDEETIDSP